jgi:hypothetical protein
MSRIEDTRAPRDLALTAVFLGFFAAAWFGWAQADTDQPVLLGIASVVSLATAIAGLVIALRSSGEGSPMRSREANRRYGIMVGIEFALAFVGSAILGTAGLAAYIPVWVAFVVGVHFFPLAPVLRDPGIVPLGVAMCVVAAVGLVRALTTDVAASTFVGVAAGLLLLGYSWLGLAGVRRRARLRAA